jgi:hypothetical protein
LLWRLKPFIQAGSGRDIAPSCLVQLLARFCNSVCPSHHPDPQSTEVGTSEMSADFRPNNSPKGVATASDGPELPRHGRISPRTAEVDGLWVRDHNYWSQTRWPDGTIWVLVRFSDQINSRTCSGTLNPSPTVVRGLIWPRRARCSPSLVFATPFAHHATPDA